MPANVQVGIYFDVGDLKKWLRALTRIETEGRRQSRDTPRLGSIDYKQLIIRNIMGQRHMAGYAPYHTRYAAWKAQYGRAHGYWKLFGDLVRNIVSTRTTYPFRTGQLTYAFFAGIPAGVKDQGGKSWLIRNTRRRSALANKPKPIAWYARIMEKGSTRGGQRHPARPIFEPSMEEYAQGGWLQRGDEALREIGKKWR